MKLHAAYVKRIADATGFDPVQLEVIRLRQLLIEFCKHSFLRERLVLKGGTTVNLFYLELARLSVDIDLNYIGLLEREEMLRQRPEVIKATEQTSLGLGYKLQRGAEDYALSEWFLAYQNHIGSPDQIQVEINFLMRASALAPQLRQAISIGDEPACEFPVLAIEEVFAGKIRAVIDRKHPRDLYDLFRLGKAHLTYDSELMRKLAVLFGSTLNRDLRSQIKQNTSNMRQSSSDAERPLSEESKGILNLAVAEADRLDDKQIGNEHLLLGVMTQGKCRAARLLVQNGMSLENVRERAARLKSDLDLAEKDTPECSPTNRLVRIWHSRWIRLSKASIQSSQRDVGHSTRRCG